MMVMGSLRSAIILILASALHRVFVNGVRMGSSAPAPTREVLVLDLDGTLYEDDCEIEMQIRDNCWVWGKERFDLDPDACQKMHEKWGSTIRGVCEELGAPVEETVRQYYNEVYPNMEFGRLRKYSINTGTDSSGYSHGLQSGEVLRSLKKLNCPIVLASNSPVFHVKRALTRLGIADLNIHAFMTPERIGGILKTDSRFWEPLFDMFPSKDYRCSLIDDNGLNINLVSQKLGMRGFRITPQQSLAENLLRFLGVNTEEGKEEGFTLDPKLYLEAKAKVDDNALNKEVFTRLEHDLKRQAASLQITSSPVKVVDLGAGLLNMLPRIMSILESDLKGRDTGGKGHLLEYLAFESNSGLQTAIREKLQQLGFASYGKGAAGEAHEYRYKAPNSGLSVTVYVSEVDFMSEKATQVSKLLFRPGKYTHSDQGDNEGDVRPAGAPVMGAYSGADLIIGCCVADLVEPRALAAQVLEFAGDMGGMLYLPITFAGRTQLRRSGGGENEAGKEGGVDSLLRVPSDEVVMDAYHAHLRKCGHHLDPRLLVRTLEQYGCSSIMEGAAEGQSQWRISRTEHPYMFQSMLHFLALGTVFQQMDLWDIRGWFSAVNNALLSPRGDKGNPAEFVVDNVDLLFRLPSIPQSIAAGDEELRPGDSRVKFGDVTAETVDVLRHTPPLSLSGGTANGGSGGGSGGDEERQRVGLPSTRHSVEFLGNSKVHVVEEPVEEVLAPGHVLIETSCSVISTGTELKVYRGDVDPDEPADLTISGMQEKGMHYPLRYGYSLVGVVVKVGEGVDAEEWLGRRVFAFSPHSSVVVAPTSALMLVPDGISDEDAAFLPSVETAVSLAMAAAPLLGERVAVVGQGLIGLLTGAVLRAANVDVTLIDVSPVRLRAAKKFIPEASLFNPSTGAGESSSGGAQKNGDFDVVVEVSGSASGLQGAVDMAGKNGRVVLGSLYGEDELSLKLGLQFHRSGIQLVTSQVSMIPPTLKGRWTKKRRFDVSWDFIRRIRPSRVLMNGDDEHDRNLVRAFLDTASMQETFRRLERGEVVSSLVMPRSARSFSSSPELQDDLSF